MIQGFKDVLMGSKKNPYMDEDKQQEELEQETINIKEKISRNLEHLKAIDASPTFIRIGEEQSVQDRIQFVEDHLRNQYYRRLKNIFGAEANNDRKKLAMKASLRKNFVTPNLCLSPPVSYFPERDQSSSELQSITFGNTFNSIRQLKQQQSGSYSHSNRHETSSMPLNFRFNNDSTKSFLDPVTKFKNREISNGNMRMLHQSNRVKLSPQPNQPISLMKLQESQLMESISLLKQKEESLNASFGQMKKELMNPYRRRATLLKESPVQKVKNKFQKAFGLNQSYDAPLVQKLEVIKSNLQSMMFESNDKLVKSNSNDLKSFLGNTKTKPQLIDDPFKHQAPEYVIVHNSIMNDLQEVNQNYQQTTVTEIDQSMHEKTPVSNHRDFILRNESDVHFRNQQIESENRQTPNDSKVENMKILGNQLSNVHMQSMRSTITKTINKNPSDSQAGNIVILQTELSPKVGVRKLKGDKSALNNTQTNSTLSVQTDGHNHHVSLPKVGSTILPEKINAIRSANELIPLESPVNEEDKSEAVEQIIHEEDLEGQPILEEINHDKFELNFQSLVNKINMSLMKENRSDILEYDGIRGPGGKEDPPYRVSHISQIQEYKMMQKGTNSKKSAQRYTNQVQSLRSSIYGSNNEFKLIKVQDQKGYNQTLFTEKTAPAQSVNNSSIMDEEMLDEIEHQAIQKKEHNLEQSLEETPDFKNLIIVVPSSESLVAGPNPHVVDSQSLSQISFKIDINSKIKDMVKQNKVNHQNIKEYLLSIKKFNDPKKVEYKNKELQDQKEQASYQMIQNSSSFEMLKQGIINDQAVIIGNERFILQPQRSPTNQNEIKPTLIRDPTFNPQFMKYLDQTERIDHGTQIGMSSIDATSQRKGGLHEFNVPNIIKVPSQLLNMSEEIDTQDHEHQETGVSKINLKEGGNQVNTTIDDATLSAQKSGVNLNDHHANSRNILEKVESDLHERFPFQSTENQADMDASGHSTEPMILPNKKDIISEINHQPQTTRNKRNIQIKPNVVGLVTNFSNALMVGQPPNDQSQFFTASHISTIDIRNSNSNLRATESQRERASKMSNHNISLQNKELAEVQFPWQLSQPPKLSHFSMYGPKSLRTSHKQIAAGMQQKPKDPQPFISTKLGHPLEVLLKEQPIPQETAYSFINVNNQVEQSIKTSFDERARITQETEKQDMRINLPPIHEITIHKDPVFDVGSPSIEKEGTILIKNSPKAAATGTQQQPEQQMMNSIGFSAKSIELQSHEINSRSEVESKEALDEKSQRMKKAQMSIAALQQHSKSNENIKVTDVTRKITPDQSMSIENPLPAESLLGSLGIEVKEKHKGRSKTTIYVQAIKERDMIENYQKIQEIRKERKENQKFRSQISRSMQKHAQKGSTLKMTSLCTLEDIKECENDNELISRMIARIPDQVNMDLPIVSAPFVSRQRMNYRTNSRVAQLQSFTMGQARKDYPEFSDNSSNDQAKEYSGDTRMAHETAVPRTNSIKTMRIMPIKAKIEKKIKKKEQQAKGNQQPSIILQPELNLQSQSNFAKNSDSIRIETPLDDPKIMKSKFSMSSSKGMAQIANQVDSAIISQHDSKRAKEKMLGSTDRSFRTILINNPFDSNKDSLEHITQIQTKQIKLKNQRGKGMGGGFKQPQRAVSKISKPQDNKFIVEQSTKTPLNQVFAELYGSLDKQGLKSKNFNNLDQQARITLEDFSVIRNSSIELKKFAETPLNKATQN